MKEHLQGTYFAKTDIGRVRLSNEDRALATLNSKGQTLLCVCDGMGGANKGDYASKLAIEKLESEFLKGKIPDSPFFAKLWFTHAGGMANRAVYGAAEESYLYKGMGTTMVAALLLGNKVLVANIGDSRAYMLKNGKLMRLTEDQTYVSYLLRTGKIDEEGAAVHPDRHVLMNALGIYPSLSISYSVYPHNGETLLLCTDGLYNSLSEKDMAAILLTTMRTDQKVEMLLRLANESGGTDNSGVALWEAIA